MSISVSLSDLAALFESEMPLLRQAITSEALYVAGTNITITPNADGKYEISASGGTATTDASALITGTLNDARLSANVPLKNALENIFAQAMRVVGVMNVGTISGIGSSLRPKFAVNPASTGKTTRMEMWGTTSSSSLLGLAADGGTTDGLPNATPWIISRYAGLMISSARRDYDSGSGGGPIKLIFPDADPTYGSGVIFICNSYSSGAYRELGRISETGNLSLLPMASIANSTTSAIIADATYSGAASAGFGVRDTVKAKSSTTASRDASYDDTLWTDATDAIRTSARKIWLSRGGTMTECMVVDNSDSATDTNIKILHNGTLKRVVVAADGTLKVAV